ncbi:uncharacterized protein LOC121623551 [Chelmon rostratus]|uniref:uncharacterized protein LOC121623551 n=1 Tax=Chelmon rostratus TaxID=109905 RepID=UPI001BE5B77F|nr:uncharacterized protein LOC121623551 [Chelmon rostratus]
MGQNRMASTLPAEAACGNSVTDMGPDESVLILIKHCRDMKQQETRLRLITLLLLLTCMALFIFNTGVGLRQRESTGASGQESAAEQSLDYAKEEKVCATGTPPTNLKQHINLRSVATDNKGDGVYIKWDVMLGERYDPEKRAIVILETGVYFVYLRIALNCLGGDRDGNFKRFYVQLHTWNKGYNKTVTLTEAWDSIACTPQGSRSFFVGQLFELLKDDHVSVWIGVGYEHITKSSFGAYLIENRP